MRRSLPVWLAAVVPATIVGHAIAYATSGRPMGDAHHAWLAPVLESSTAILVAIALALVGGALIKARVLTHTLAERSLSALWPRMAIAQVILFAAIERVEGTPASLFGCAVQVAVALVAALLLTAFARVLAACDRSADEAGRYLERLFATASWFVGYQPPLLARTLAVSCGTRRFVRPPPQA